MAGRYEYQELVEKALATGAKEDIEALAEWFKQYGDMYWNGEYYEIDKYTRLVPVYEETEPDEWECVSWEIE